MNSAGIFSVDRYRDQSVHVVGISGSEGFAVLEFLVSRGFTRVTGHDILEDSELRQSFETAHIALSKEQRSAAFQRLMALPVRRYLGSDYLRDIDTARLIFAGQNWAAHSRNRCIHALRAQGIPVRFITQLYFEMSPAPVAAVTGTNGKTTVSNWLEHVIRGSGRRVLMSGNDRYHPQVLNRVHSLSPADILILEVSNRQLVELDRGPAIAVLTNVAGDHIQEHGSMEAYQAVKERLFQLQSPQGTAVINLDDDAGKCFAARCPARVFPYTLGECPSQGAGLNGKDYGIRYDTTWIPLFRQTELPLPGRHNVSNALAVAAAAFSAGVSPESIRAGLLDFSGVRNRIQFIQAVGNTRWYDDLAATNPSASLAALSAFSGPVVMIIGGDRKGEVEEYTALARCITDRVNHLVVLPGTGSECLVSLVGNTVSVHRVQDLETAVWTAFNHSDPHGTILLSPAGAGFYSRYILNSKGFRRVIRDIARREKNERT